MRLTRREWLGSTAMWPALANSQTPVVVRRPVSQLGQDEVELLREAYTSLQEEGPVEWRLEALRDLHKNNCTGDESSTNVHLNWNFLPWHRALMYLHECVLRKVLGKPHFRLPYWDWEKGIPTCYESPADKSNPLWRDRGVAGFSSMLRQKFADHTPWREFLNSQEFTNGNGGLGGGEKHEGEASRSTLHQYPHDVSLEMSSGQEAAYDPLFYIHHAAVDRAWVMWERDQPPDPNCYPSKWLDCKHHFPRKDGEHVVLQNRRLLDIHGLGYEYPSGVSVRFEPGGRKISFSSNIFDDGTLVSLSSDVVAGLKPIGDPDTHVYFWVTGFLVAASEERIYTLWMTPAGKRAPALRLGVQGTFGSPEGPSGYTLNIPFSVGPSDLLSLVANSDNAAAPGFQLYYAPGEIETDTLPASASLARFETVSAVIRTSRILAGV